MDNARHELTIDIVKLPNVFTTSEVKRTRKKKPELQLTNIISLDVQLLYASSWLVDVR